MNRWVRSSLSRNSTAAWCSRWVQMAFEHAVHHLLHIEAAGDGAGGIVEDGQFAGLLARQCGSCVPHCGQGRRIRRAGSECRDRPDRKRGGSEAAGVSPFLLRAERVPISRPFCRRGTTAAERVPACSSAGVGVTRRQGTRARGRPRRGGRRGWERHREGVRARRANRSPVSPARRAIEQHGLPGCDDGSESESLRRMRRPTICSAFSPATATKSSMSRPSASRQSAALAASVRRRASSTTICCTSPTAGATRAFRSGGEWRRVAGPLGSWALPSLFPFSHKSERCQASQASRTELFAKFSGRSAYFNI